MILVALGIGYKDATKKSQIPGDFRQKTLGTQLSGDATKMSVFRNKLSESMSY
tara:strand:+ start:331 stop:489 length:159 start_codon:yes stop_codon:yes gene_type:complete